jgi:hypothetical protein
MSDRAFRFVSGFFFLAAAVAMLVADALHT